MCWWALSSATKRLDHIGQFIGGQGVCTIFHMEVHTAIDITEYSIFQEDEDERRMPFSASLAVVVFCSPTEFSAAHIRWMAGVALVWPHPGVRGIKQSSW